MANLIIHLAWPVIWPSAGGAASQWSLYVDWIHKDLGLSLEKQKISSTSEKHKEKKGVIAVVEGIRITKCSYSFLGFTGCAGTLYI